MVFFLYLLMFNIVNWGKLRVFDFLMLKCLNFVNLLVSFYQIVRVGFGYLLKVLVFFGLEKKYFVNLMELLLNFSNLFKGDI